MSQQLNYRVISQPKLWSSAHKPIEFVYDMPTEVATIVGLDNNLGVILPNIFAGGGLGIHVGSIVFITESQYKGYHVVKEVFTPLIFSLETAYTTAPTTPVCDVKYATPPQWQVWKGYQDSEVIGTNNFPFTKAADFAPEGNPDGFLTTNVQGFIQSSMKKMTPPSAGNQFGGISISSEINYWQPYRLLIGLSPRSLYFERIYFALNSSIESDVLNAEYLNTLKPLNTLPFINSCGTTWLSFLETSGVVTYRFENGNVFPSGGDFNNDFNNEFFNT
jgi:hypothetical protein